MLPLQHGCSHDCFTCQSLQKDRLERDHACSHCSVGAGHQTLEMLVASSSDSQFGSRWICRAVPLASGVALTAAGAVMAFLIENSCVTNHWQMVSTQGDQSMTNCGNGMVVMAVGALVALGSGLALCRSWSAARRSGYEVLPGDNGRASDAVRLDMESSLVGGYQQAAQEDTVSIDAPSSTHEFYDCVEDSD